MRSFDHFRSEGRRRCVLHLLLQCQRRRVTEPVALQTLFPRGLLEGMGLEGKSVPALQTGGHLRKDRFLGVDAMICIVE